MVGVSIIMPVYNVAPYLTSCINSVLNQTYRDFELLLIDDGSSDGSGDICDEYALNDNRIRVFHKKNEGVASARQLGMDNITGEFSIHVDSDDYIEPDMLARLVETIRTTEADILVADYFIDYEGKLFLAKQRLTGNDSNSLLDDIIFQRAHGSLCNKLVKTSVLRQNDVHFIKGVDYSEDVLVWAQLAKANLKVASLHEAFYHYIQRKNGSALTGKNNCRWLQQYRAYQKVFESMAEEAQKQYLISQIRVELLCLMIKRPATPKVDFITASTDFSWMWREVKVGKLMKLLLIYAKHISFKGAQRIFAMLDSIRR